MAFFDRLLGPGRAKRLKANKRSAEEAFADVRKEYGVILDRSRPLDLEKDVSALAVACCRSVLVYFDDASDYRYKRDAGKLALVLIGMCLQELNIRTFYR
ncbi:MAG: hypothetical protein ACLQPD_19030 [Desulfomonilaceae bacterium]